MSTQAQSGSRPSIRRSTRIATRPPPPPPKPTPAPLSRPVKRRKTRHRAAPREPTPEPPRVGIIFPVEIWRLVFKSLLDEFGVRALITAARSFSILCPEAESVLYRSVTIKSVTAATRFLHSIQVDPRRANAVRQLCLKLRGPRWVPNFQTVHGILDKIPNLTKIVVSADQGIAARFCKDFADNNRLPIISLKGARLNMNLEQVGRFLCAHSNKLEEFRLESGSPVPPSNIVKFPMLRALACNIFALRQLKDTIRNLTRLWIIDGDGSGVAVKEAIALLGPQLICLRVERHLLEDRSILNPNYPTALNWGWERCTRLRHLHVDEDIHSLRSGQRLRRWDPPSYLWNNHGGPRDELVRERDTLPPRLEILLWTPLWAKPQMNLSPQTPDHRHRSALRSYVTAALERFPSVEAFIYRFDGEGCRHCYLSDHGDLMEAPMDVDTDSICLIGC